MLSKEIEALKNVLNMVKQKGTAALNEPKTWDY